MRVMVVSDTHGNVHNLRRAIFSQPKAEVVVHCGDGEADLNTVKLEFPERMFIAVRGNCDWGSQLPVAEEITLEGKRLVITHGHAYNVKHGYYDLKLMARDRKADVVLFGHTHEALTEYKEGLYMMNPGSLSGHKPTYGILDITEAGIVTSIVRNVL